MEKKDNELEEKKTNKKVVKKDAENKIELKEKVVDEKPVEKKESFFRKHAEGLIFSLITFIICVVLFGLFYEYYLKHLVIETTRYVNDITVTDKGIADAVDKVYDSVVVIETYEGNQKSGSGTGFVYKTDDKYGYIITNHHVIEDASIIKVKFSNEKMVEAKIVGSDEYADVAVLAVDKEYVIKTAVIGDSEKTRIGDTTFAVGAPIDSNTFSWSVTRGIISGKNRIVEVGDRNTTNIMSVLQTDTPINAGNSGGVLCDSNGEVIGVTNMKLASSQVEGMGFAIPIEDAVRYAESIISGEKIARPYLGVSMYDANNFRDGSTGVYIEYVQEGSVAEKAGLQRGDKILKINDAEITSSAYFKYELYKHKLGEKIKITVERNGSEKVLNVTLSGSNVN